MRPTLQAKISPPPLPQGCLPRPRVDAAFDRATASPITLVQAPAGYGKTTATLQWLRSTDVPAAWLSLSASDDDPATFWRHLLDAVAYAFDHSVGDSAKQFLRGRSEWIEASDVAITALLNELHAHFRTKSGDGRPGDVALVIDDFHLLVNPRILSSFGEFLDYVPQGFRVILLSRTAPALSLARRRAHGMVETIGVGELAFDRDETESFLRQTLQAPIGDEALHRLRQHTGGWAAALRLAAHTAGIGAANSELLAANEHRAVSDYWIEEILRFESAENRDLLLAHSCLPRVNARLSDHLLHRRDSAARLEALAAAGMMVSDDGEGWYRYHDVLREGLAMYHHNAMPDKLASTRAKAAAWFEARGHLKDAFELFVLNGDGPSAARCARQSLVLRGLRMGLAEIRRLVDALQDLAPEELNSCPLLLLAQVRALDPRKQATESEPYLERAEARARDLVAAKEGLLGGPIGENVLSVVLGVRSYFARMSSPPRLMLAEVDEALALVRNSPPLIRLPPAAERARTRYFAGMTGAAAEELADVILQAMAVDELDAAIMALSYAARGFVATGQLARARDLGDRVRDWIRERNLEQLPIARCHALAMAEYFRELGDRDQAVHMLTLSQHFNLETQFQPMTDILHYGIRCETLLSFGDLAGVGNEVAQIESLQGFVCGWTFAGRSPRGIRALLALLEGNRVAAHSWAGETAALQCPDGHEFLLELDRLTSARILVHTGELALARDVLDKVEAPALAGHRWQTLVSVHALRALARNAEGDSSGAVDALNEALDLCDQFGFVRALLDQGDLFVLLQQAATRGSGNRQRRCAEMMLSRIADNAGASHELVEALTVRETEVLSELALGKSNREIASDLGIGVGTVKTHTLRIYSKLGAANRTQAVRLASRLGLLPAA